MSSRKHRSNRKHSLVTDVSKVSAEVKNTVPQPQNMQKLHLCAVSLTRILCSCHMQASSQTIDEEDLEMRQSAWTLMTQLLQHDAAAVNAQAYSFVR